MRDRASGRLSRRDRIARTAEGRRACGCWGRTCGKGPFAHRRTEARGYDSTSRRRRDIRRVEEELRNRRAAPGTRGTTASVTTLRERSASETLGEYSRVRGGRPGSARYLQVTLRQAAVFRRTQIKGNVFVDKYQRNAELAQQQSLPLFSAIFARLATTGDPSGQLTTAGPLAIQR